MKTLYLECKMGCAGDMLMSALSELVDQDAFIEKMNAIGLPGVTLEKKDSVKCGIYGTHIEVKVHGEEEHSHDVHANEAGYVFEIPGMSDADKKKLTEKLSQVTGVKDAHMHDDTLHYTYDHDTGYVAENALREIVGSINDSLRPVSKGHDHHPHDHGHHEHHGIHHIEHILSHLDISENVRNNALQVYRLIQEAEAYAHHIPVDEIHFHEVGTMDAIADVVGNCILFEMIAADKIIASSVAVGNGMVRCAHGILPVPAPATAYLLQGIPSYAGRMQGELCTPTGAALLKHFAGEFTSQPEMITEKIGYGMGNKDFEAANCVRAFLGESEDDGELCELECTIDDETGEEIGYAIDALFAQGALDVFVTPVQMKKNRPGLVLTCACRNDKKDVMLKVMFTHLTTLGIREYHCKRHALKRSIETMHTVYGDVRIKRSEGFGVKKEKLEFDDLAEIAGKENVSIAEVRNNILKGI